VCYIHDKTNMFYINWMLFLVTTLRLLKIYYIHQGLLQLCNVGDLKSYIVQIVSDFSYREARYKGRVHQQPPILSDCVIHALQLQREH